MTPVESYVCQRRKVVFFKSSPDHFLAISISMIVHLPVVDLYECVRKGYAGSVMCHGRLMVGNNRACARTRCIICTKGSYVEMYVFRLCGVLELCLLEIIVTIGFGQKCNVLFPKGVYTVFPQVQELVTV